MKAERQEHLIQSKEEKGNGFRQARKPRPIFYNHFAMAVTANLSYQHHYEMSHSLFTVRKDRIISMFFYLAT